MTEAEKREGARQFIIKWSGRGKEDEDDRSYWLDFLSRICGVENPTDHMEFQKKVIVDGNTKRIDGYIPETKVLIEQKTLGMDLSKKSLQSGGIELTPYEQAKRYNDNLPYDEKARWIITSNFAEIWIYDMNARVPEPVKVELAELQHKFGMFDFLIKQEKKKLSEEMELSIQAGELVGKIHDRFQEQYTDPFAVHTQRSLNILCVRLVFLLYAEDTGLFGDKDAFINYVAQYEPKDIRRALIDLFKTLDTKYEERDPYLEDELAAFPYVNGGLFKDENIVIPKITEEIKQTLIDSAYFDWSRISPTIFGAVFESTLNPETRRSGGMHYTSIENIHKVIDPLFLDDLKAEFASIKVNPVVNERTRKLEAFQDKLAMLTWFDPACGSGNFLTETYISVRRIENEVIRLLLDSRKGATAGQIVFGNVFENPIKVSINQFYGIEINDFAVTVAKTALWIAESQMMKETEDVIHMNLDFLPLKTNAYIVEGNALRMNWNKVVPTSKLNYIMGNPPFVGYSNQTRTQKEDILSVYIDEEGKPYKTAGKVDYVAGWYFKAAEVMKNTSIKAAFVSTNSITQGEQVAAVWEPLYKRFGINIDYAYRTFIWDSEATSKAHVHCVIIGFSCGSTHFSGCLNIYEGNTKIAAHNINPYLIDAESIFVNSRKQPLSNVPEMVKGSSPVDGGNFFLNEEEYESYKDDPIVQKYIKRFYGAREYIHNDDRWCIWTLHANPSDINNSEFLKTKITAVRTFRLNSSKEATKKYAEQPTRFMEVRQPNGNYILVPRHTSENRRYIPLGFMTSEVICGDANNMIPNATMYHFGVLLSNVHMAWMRVVCGRIKSDYRYSNDIVYNNFPWPLPTDDQKAEIEKTAQGILDARALYPDSSLADLYDPLTMPPELRKAHTENDKAVMRAYGFDIKNTSEADCVAALMKMYQKLVEDKELNK